MLQIQNKLCMGALLLLCSTSSFAEHADREKPIHLDADQVIIDDAQQISTFLGNVQLSQGTMLIMADKIVVTEDKNGYKHGTAYGKTASFRQKREGVDEYVEGHGERIEYDTLAETVDFYGRAQVKRQLDDIRGEHITYNQKTDIFQVNSGATGSVSTLPKRVHAVLQPKAKTSVAAPRKVETLPIQSSDTLSPAE